MKELPGKGLKILFLNFHTTYPARQSLLDSIYGFRKFSAAKIYYLNLFVWNLPSWIFKVKFDAVFYSYPLMNVRFNPEAFKRRLIPIAEKLAALPCPKACFPQDECSYTDLLSEFIRKGKVTHVFSVAPESEWPKIYGTLPNEGVQFSRILTAYLNEDLVAKWGPKGADATDREIDIGYRAITAPYWGRFSMDKIWIPEKVKKLADTLGLKTNIKFENSFFGEDWYQFLLRCKTVLGVESGASLLDRDGSIFTSTKFFLEQNPGVSFEQVERECFPGLDGNLKLRALSPRNLEAALTRTCQILTEGEYSGVLVPGRHYIEVKRDLSNLRDVLSIIKDTHTLLRIADQAYLDIVATGKYSYCSFVTTVLTRLKMAPRNSAFFDRLVLVGIRLLDIVSEWFVFIDSMGGRFLRMKLRKHTA